MSIDSPKTFFRKSVFVWCIILIINIVSFVGVMGEGVLGHGHSWKAYLWFAISFLPLSFYFLYLHLNLDKKELQPSESQWTLKVLLPLFGISCLASLWYAGGWDADDKCQVLLYAALILLVFQGFIYKFLPKF